MLEKLYRLGEGSYSYVVGEHSVMTRNDVMVWADSVAYNMYQESEEYPDPPEDIDQAIAILESANEFIYEL